MNATIDSIKIKLPAEICRPDLSKFAKVTTSIGEAESVYYQAKNVMSGLNAIYYRPESNQVILQTSAKILGEDYKKLISLDTIEQYFKNIEKTGYIYFDVNDCINEGEVLTVDFCNNLKVGDVQSHLTALSCVSSSKFSTLPFVGRGDDKGKNGIVFRGNFISKKVRAIAYDKERESKDKQFKGYLRLESNFTSFKTIREAVKGSNMLVDCLTTKEQPNLRLFQKIIGSNSVNIDIMEKAESAKSVKDLAFTVLFEKILEDTNGNIKIAGEVLDACKGGRMTIYRYKQQLEAYKREKLAGSKYLDYLKNIEKLLAA